VSSIREFWASVDNSVQAHPRFRILQCDVHCEGVGVKMLTVRPD